MTDDPTVRQLILGFTFLRCYSEWTTKTQMPSSGIIYPGPTVRDAKILGDTPKYKKSQLNEWVKQKTLVAIKCRSGPQMMSVVTRTCKPVVGLGVANAGQHEKKSRNANENHCSKKILPKTYPPSLWVQKGIIGTALVCILPICFCFDVCLTTTFVSLHYLRIVLNFFSVR